MSQLEAENTKLEASVKQLESSVSTLKATKEKLDAFQSVQGQTIDELERQLTESRKILEMQKDSLSGDILSNIMTVVLAADDDGDMLLSDAEIDEVTKNIEGLHGVDFNDAQLKKLIISKGRDIPGTSKPILFEQRFYLDLITDNLFVLSHSKGSWTWSKRCWNQIRLRLL